MLSPDKDFSPAGSTTGIDYSQSFDTYKRMITEDPTSPSYARIIAEYDVALFGKVRVLKNTFVADDSDYGAVANAFQTGLRKDEAEARARANSVLPPPTPSESHWGQRGSYLAGTL